MARALSIWMNGARVGTWTGTRTGLPSLIYDPAWLASRSSRALSLSLPITPDHQISGAVVNHYFDNLLPDSPAIRKRLGSLFKVDSADAFDLLSAIGRDCVGAVQLLPEGVVPAPWDQIDAQPMSEDEVAHHVQVMTSTKAFGANDIEQDFRISIAGAQEKTALLQMGSKWYRPQGVTPTTHIIKLPLGLVGNMRADMSQSVENEWLCAQLVREMGIPVAHTEMVSFGTQPALVVERFDRRWQGVDASHVQQAGFKPPPGAWIARLPQEDFCQALGLSSNLKYQADGGPGIEAGLRILANSDNAAVDQAHFLKAQFVFWLMAVTDGHAKNFSIAHKRGGTFSMTPLYDVLSAWPIMGAGGQQLAYQRAKLAMAVRGNKLHYRLGDVRARHWQSLTLHSSVPEVWDQLIATASTVDDTLKRTEAHLPANFPVAVWRPIAQGIQRHASQFLRELALTTATE